MIFESIENLYIIRANGQSQEHKTFSALESTLKNAAGVIVKHEFAQISSISALVYDFSLIEELKEEGYEVIPQYRSFSAL